MKKLNLHSLSSQHLADLAYKQKKAGKKYWDSIMELHTRGTRIELGIAKDFMKRENPIFREIAADIFGQLGYKKNKFFKESEKNLIFMLQDNHYKVISAAAIALGHRFSKKAVPYLYKLKNHKNRAVRFGVTFGLLAQNDPLAIEAMIILSKDRAKDVRNWATFGLGSMIEENNPEIENALIERLDEKDLEIRSEALVGLVKRKHKDAVKWVKKNLADQPEVVITGFLDAAQELGSIDLLPELKAIEQILTGEENSYFISCLQEAIAACNNENPKKISD